jgi:hypothetical protein
MAKRKAGEPKMTATEPEIRHARLELSGDDYKRMKNVAKANGLSVAAYIRQAVLQRIRRDEGEIAD